jgi:hypothetical protein
MVGGRIDSSPSAWMDPGSPKAAANQEPAPTVVPGRACGACTLCCKVFDLPEFDSPVGQWCRHCAPGRGCTIHATRADLCRSFFCGWMVRPDLGPEWKPDEAHLIVRILNAGQIPCLVINVDDSYPAAWRRPDIYRQLKQFAGSGRGFVHVQIGRHHIVFIGEREIDMGLLAVDEEAKISLRGGRLEVRKVKRANLTDCERAATSSTS